MIHGRGKDVQAGGVRSGRVRGFLGCLRANRQLLFMMAVPLAWLLIFRYGPMYGAQIAFRNYSPVRGFWESPWVGLRHFSRFLQSPTFLSLIGNTLGVSLYSLAAGFPVPILLALALQYSGGGRFRRVVQTVSYAPHFISTVVIVGILMLLLNPRDGVVNQFLGVLGMDPVYFMAEPRMFRSLYVWSGVWQSAGFGSVIYLAALSAVDPQLHEAAVMDGASKVRRIWHIDLPGIMPTAVILLILSFGGILSVGFEKAFLMQNDLNVGTAEVIDTYVYKIGLASAGANPSYAAAIGLFQSIIGFFLVVGVNAVSRRLTEASLW
jgi:putative aldouronate transport system permease protein